VLRVGALNDDYRLNPEDPGRVTVGIGSVNTNIFDTLIRMDANFQLHPMLAESWEHLEDSGAWRFHLRQGVTFHNGQLFTAKAVLETMNRITLGEYGNVLNIDANSTMAVDEYTVDIKPLAPDLRLPGRITHPIFGIRAPGSDPFRGEHIGTGPFKLVEYVKDDHISVEKNVDYWGPTPQVDQIEFRFMPDPETRVAALQAQEVDIIYNVPLEAAEHLSNVGHVRALPATVGAYQAISILLTGEKPYDIAQDILVREAIGYAIDRQAIINTVFNGFAADNQTLVPPDLLGQSADKIRGYMYGPEQARALLEEAGWQDTDRDGIREKGERELMLELISGFPNGPDNRQTPKILQAQFRAVGIKLKITSVPDITSYEALLANKRGDLWLEIGNQNSASPCFNPRYLYYGRDPNPNIYQLAYAPRSVGWSVFDDEIDNCSTASNSTEAALYAANAMHILVDEARAVIPLVGLYQIWFASDEIQNFEPHPIFVMVRWDTVSVIR
jgi:ABC-type transport system substrate-binding protein